MHRFVGVSSSKRKEFNSLIESMEGRLREELATASAPKTGRLQSYSNLRSYEVRVVVTHCAPLSTLLQESLQLDFLSLVKYNDHLDEKLESVKRYFINDQVALDHINFYNSQAKNQLAKVKNLRIYDVRKNTSVSEENMIEKVRHTQGYFIVIVLTCDIIVRIGLQRVKMSSATI